MTGTRDRSKLAAAAPLRPNELIEKIAFAVIIAYIAFLVSAYATGVWLVDGQGQTIQTDFINVWAAGRLVLAGKPADAYDWPLHKAVEEQGIGHPFDKYFGWHYPPPFLFIAALLAFLPYLTAFLVWMTVTLPVYAVTIRAIVGQRIAWALACAFPAVLWNFATGQNGFLTAALVGGALETMEQRPQLAGFLVGLLSYKPQFGLLFPLVLAVSGRWRVFFSAALTVLAMIGASWWAFGSQTWQGFFDWLPMTSQLVFGAGLANFRKLQTVFGVVRTLGQSEDLAWALQIAVAAACAIALSWLWRQRLAYEIKAAALAIATLIVTPYLYLYDLVVLAVPIAFVIRLGLREGFFPLEIAACLLAAALILIDPLGLLYLPTGVLAVLVISLVVGRRAVVARKACAAAAITTA